VAPFPNEPSIGLRQFRVQLAELAKDASVKEAEGVEMHPAEFHRRYSLALKSSAGDMTVEELVGLTGDWYSATDGDRKAADFSDGSLLDGLR